MLYDKSIVSFVHNVNDGAIINNIQVRTEERYLGVKIVHSLELRKHISIIGSKFGIIRCYFFMHLLDPQ